MSPWHDRMTARSSTQPATCGKRSETSMPLWPYLRKVRFVPRSRAFFWTNWYLASPNSPGRGWPSSRFRSGLGSNVSKWLGPPAMNRKMTARALAGRWGGFAASGSAGAARACSWSKSAASARPPKPQKASRMNSRRERVGRAWGQASGDIQELIEVEQREGEFPQWLLAQEGERQRTLVGGRRPAQRQPEPPLDDPLRLAARLPPQAAGERLGQFVRQ